jgi:hypothetical protein
MDKIRLINFLALQNIFFFNSAQNFFLFCPGMVKKAIYLLGATKKVKIIYARK